MLFNRGVSTFELLDQPILERVVLAFCKRTSGAMGLKLVSRKVE
jgi:hypothetical protein